MGVPLMLEIVMSTVSATLSTVPSLTIREKVKVTGVFEVSVGAVKLGEAAAASDKLTLVPAVWVQAKVTVSPSGSDEAEPSRETDTASFTD